MHMASSIVNTSQKRERPIAGSYQLTGAQGPPAHSARSISKDTESRRHRDWIYIYIYIYIYKRQITSRLERAESDLVALRSVDIRTRACQQPQFALLSSFAFYVCYTHRSESASEHALPRKSDSQQHSRAARKNPLLEVVVPLPKLHWHSCVSKFGLTVRGTPSVSQKKS